jgi:hypothetical protein
VQKLYELKGPCPDPPDLVGLLDRVQVEANLVCATPRRRHDIVVRGEVPDEKCLRRRGLGVGTSIGHRLAATGLVIRIFNVETEAFQELESGNANLGVKGVDVAGNEQPDAHG